MVAVQPIIAEKKPLQINVDDPAPTFFLRDLDGKNFFLSKAIKEKQPIVLSFFATWCIPCRTEIPVYENMLKNEKYQNIKLLYIHVGEPKVDADQKMTDLELILKMKQNLDMTHTILYDRYGVAADKYGAASLPTTVVIAPTGKIAYYHTGFKSGDELKVEKILLQLLK